MTTREDITNQLLTQKVLIDLMRDADAVTRETAKTLFTRVGQREIGELAGQELGSVQLTKPRESWTVVDREAFTAWVEDNYPDEIVEVTAKSVRSSFERAVIDRAKAGNLIDEETGEVIVPPGVIPKVGKPILTVKPAEGAERIVLDALGDTAVLLGLAIRAELEA